MSVFVHWLWKALYDQHGDCTITNPASSCTAGEVNTARIATDLPCHTTAHKTQLCAAGLSPGRLQYEVPCTAAAQLLWLQKHPPVGCCGDAPWGFATHSPCYAAYGGKYWQDWQGAQNFNVRVSTCSLLRDAAAAELR